MGRHVCVELPSGDWTDLEVDDQVGTTLAGAAGVGPEDPWVRAVVESLEREPSWCHRFGGEGRPELTVKPGRAEMFHTTSRLNRSSIAEHGLDWERMGVAPGIAGSRSWEAPAIFLNDDRWGADWFARMGTDAFGGPALHPEVDIWAVDATGLWIENGPDGWWMAFDVLGPERLRLVEH